MKSLESLKGIFKDRIFKIPDYQRGYTWQEKQLTDFWSDIVNLPTDRFHYTGLLSLKEAKESDFKEWSEEKWLIEKRGIKPFFIVDGQQRIASFIIFLKAILNLILNLPENKGKSKDAIYIGTFTVKEVEEEYLVISQPPNHIVKSYKFGYENDNPSFQYLRYYILEEPYAGHLIETFYTLNLKNALLFFEENLRITFEKLGFSEIEELFFKLTQSLMFNIHEIQDDFDVFIAFETMNNRGKPLSKLELLKNRLIYLTTLYSENELKNNDRLILREKINDAWKEVYFQLGRNGKKPLSDDDYLIAHWIMYFQYARQKGDDYIKFLLDEKFTSQNVFNKTEIALDSFESANEAIDIDESDDENLEKDDSIEDKTQFKSKLSPNEIDEYVGSLKSSAKHWYNTFNPLNNPELSTEESLWIDKLNRLGIAYFRPLIATSFIAPNVTESDRLKLFKAIERFIFVTFRLGRAFVTYRNNQFFKATRKLRKGEINIDEICRNLNEKMEWLFHVNEGDPSNTSYFNFGPFKTFMTRLYKNAGGFYDWKGLRYFLYEYESDKVQKFGNQKIDWIFFTKGEEDKVSIEHIYPQTPTNDYWKKAFNDFTEEQKKLLTGSLGNLLPLSMSINSSLQNDSFPDKVNPKESSISKNRRGYFNGSHSEIEVADKYKDWNGETILQR